MNSILVVSICQTIMVAFRGGRAIYTLRFLQSLRLRAGGPTHPLPVAKATGGDTKIIKALTGRHIRSWQECVGPLGLWNAGDWKPGLVSPGKGYADPSGLNRTNFRTPFYLPEILYGAAFQGC